MGTSLLEMVLQMNSFVLQNQQPQAESNWAAFDDLATERSSRLDSADSAQRPETVESQSSQEEHTSSAPSEEGGGWAAFASDPPAFQSDNPAFQDESAAFEDLPSNRQSAQNDRQMSGSHAQSPPSASWAAFDEPSSNQADSPPVKSAQQDSRSDSTSAPMQTDEKPLPHAEFGESNYWRTHPLDLVDIVD